MHKLVSNQEHMHDKRVQTEKLAVEQLDETRYHHMMLYLIIYVKIYKCKGERKAQV